MTRDTAKQFWKEYIKLACAKGSDSIMLNPSLTLISQVHIGKFDEMSDDE